MKTNNLSLLALIILGAAPTAFTGCSPATTTADPPASGTGGGLAVSGGSGGTTTAAGGNSAGGGLNIGDGDGDVAPSLDVFSKFPDPIYDGVTSDQAAAFTADLTNPESGVCVFEPHLSDANGVGALFPMNWLRPRFRWTGAGGETAWEIRLTAGSQGTPILAYTNQTQWIMPKDMWDEIAAGVRDDIQVSIRGVGGASMVGMSGSFRVTSALAGGSMVFWGTSSSLVGPGTSSLYGFTMGDEAVVDTLAAEQVSSISRVYTAVGSDLRGDLHFDAVDGVEAGAPRCIGCHSATPDGAAMAFTDDYPWNMGIASVAENSTGAAPDYLSAGARQLLKIPFLGTGTMLAVPWAEGDRTMITTMGRRSDSSSPYIYINYGYNEPPTYEPTTHDLIWIDLETTASIADTLPAPDVDGTSGNPPWDVDYTGEPRKEAARERGEDILDAQGSGWDVLLSEGNLSISNPAASKTGLRIAYSVSESSYDGHPDWHNNTADIKIVDLTSPRAASPSGVALAGASDPGMLEYYPSWSPDDAFIAFNRAPAPTNTSRCAQGKAVDPTNPDGATCDNPVSGLGDNPDGPYYNRKGEIHIVSSAGGTPHRLRGNDPVMCSGEASPGVINSWPKWSSAVRTENGKTYYFVIFSSARGYAGQFNLEKTENTPPIDTRSSQLYMSVVEVDSATGAMASYAPIYLWNQNYLATGPDSYVDLPTANLTPAWEDFTIPSVPPVEVVK